MMISEKDKETYAAQGFLILRQAFTQTRIAALLEGIERLIDKGLAGECEIGWIDRERRLPSPAPATCSTPISTTLPSPTGSTRTSHPISKPSSPAQECVTACSACSPAAERSPIPRNGTATSANQATRKKPRTCTDTRVASCSSTPRSFPETVSSTSSPAVTDGHRRPRKSKRPAANRGTCPTPTSSN